MPRRCLSAAPLRWRGRRRARKGEGKEASWDFRIRRLLTRALSYGYFTVNPFDAAPIRPFPLSGFSSNQMHTAFRERDPDFRSGGDHGQSGWIGFFRGNLLPQVFEDIFDRFAQVRGLQHDCFCASFAAVQLDNLGSQYDVDVFSDGEIPVNRIRNRNPL